MRFCRNDETGRVHGIVSFEDLYRRTGYQLWKLCRKKVREYTPMPQRPDLSMRKAEKMKGSRIVIWGMHGIYGVGRTMDEAFGLIETVEKAAQIYMLTAAFPRVNTIKDS